MRRKTVYRAIQGIDRGQLEAFQAGMRKRYSDDHILAELQGCAKRLGRSPTMREFEADPETTVHPQTVIEHFGSWNRAKRLAGLVPRRFATKEELLRLLRELGDELGRVPTAKDIEVRKGSMPSKSLYWHTFGSLNNALKQAGFDVPVGEERLERAIEQGAALAVRTGRLPKFADWAQARRSDDTMLTEWQVYRMFDARRGAWSTFQFLIRQRLEDQGVAISPEGRIANSASAGRLAAAQIGQAPPSISVRSSSASSAARASSIDSPGCRSRASISSQATSRGPMLSTARASAGAPRSASSPSVSSIGACSVTAALRFPSENRRTYIGGISPPRSM